MPRENIHSPGSNPDNAHGVVVRWDPRGGGTVSVGAGSFDGAPDALTALYVDLDRDGVQALIRHLRRARNGTWGGDE